MQKKSIGSGFSMPWHYLADQLPDDGGRFNGAITKKYRKRVGVARYAYDDFADEFKESRCATQRRR